MIDGSTDNLPYEKIGNGKPVCIADEVPFEIPESWEWVRHNELFEISGGSQPPKSKFITEPKEGYIRLYQIRDYGSNPIPIYIPKETANKTTQKGDILLARYGASLGKVFIAEDGAYNVAMAKVIPRFSGSWITREFMFLYYQSDLYQAVIRRHSRSAQAGFNKDDLSVMWLPIPPLAEQQRIANKYNEILPFINKFNDNSYAMEKLNAEFPEQLKKSILQWAIQGKLVPQDPNDEPASVLLERIRAKKERLIQGGKIKGDKYESVIYRRDNSYYEKINEIERCIDDEILFDVPDSWAWCKLKFLVSKEIKRGKSPKYTDMSDVYVFAQKCNMKRGGIDMSLAKCLDMSSFSKYPEEEHMQDGDIVINSTGNGTLGRIGVFRDSDRIDDKTIVPDSHVTVVRTFPDLDGEYVYDVLCYYQPFLEKQGEGSTNQTELKPMVISELYIPIPPLEEQHRIVNVLHNLMEYAQRL